LGQTETSAKSPGSERPVSSAVISLDGDQWLVAADPENVGRDQNWQCEPRPEAKPTKVPWIIQDPFPACGSVAA
jgi:hypothetical protein